MSTESKPTRIPHITPEFGHYFAGIADGEAHFGIAKQTKKRTGYSAYACFFVLFMRDDDRQFLEWLRDTTGIGSFYDQKARQKVGHRSKPQVIWKVQNQRDCSVLADIFEEYPLRTRKARDCAIWISAVRYQAGDRPFGWEPMVRWFNLIRQVRRYDGLENEPEPELDILSLFPDEAWANA